MHRRLEPYAVRTPDGVDVEALIGRWSARRSPMPASQRADIDEVFVGQINAGFARQEFPSSLVMQSEPGLRFKRATRVENACATGSAASMAASPASPPGARGWCWWSGSRR